TKGAIVSDVMSNSPAEQAGLKPGDIILEFNGTPISDVRDLQNKVADAKIGETVNLGVWREKKKINIPIKIAERPEEETIAKTESESIEKPWRGLTVSDITNELRKRFGIGSNIQGVIVLNVEPGSAADECEITSGTIIRRINDYNISSIKDFKAAVDKIDKKASATLWVLQEGNNRFCVLKGE
ncbi:MAG TPA: PDZ domain-containing protein, partial [bacterium]|nr:PDZ domain-containing protein [bacterium]